MEVYIKKERLNDILDFVLDSPNIIHTPFIMDDIQVEYVGRLETTTPGLTINGFRLFLKTEHGQLFTDIYPHPDNYAATSAFRYLQVVNDMFESPSKYYRCQKVVEDVTTDEEEI
jgi:hypothetical protein